VVSLSSTLCDEPEPSDEWIAPDSVLMRVLRVCRGERLGIPTPLLLLCVFLAVFGALYYFNPGQPFVLQYLTTQKDLTAAQVTAQVFPVWTYSQLPMLILVGVFAEYLTGYQPIIALGALANCFDMPLLKFGTDLWSFQLDEVVVGAGVACVSVFSAYVYCLVPDRLFPHVTSLVRTSFLLGTVTSSLFGQLIVSTTSLPLISLWYFSFSTSAICLVIALLLPHDSACRRARAAVQLSATGRQSPIDALPQSSTTYPYASSMRVSSPASAPMRPTASVSILSLASPSSSSFVSSWPSSATPSEACVRSRSSSMLSMMSPPAAQRSDSSPVAEASVSRCCETTVALPAASAIYQPSRSSLSALELANRSTGLSREQPPLLLTNDEETRGNSSTCSSGIQASGFQVELVSTTPSFWQRVCAQGSALGRGTQCYAQDLTRSYANEVLPLSVWFVLYSAVHALVITYYQSLFAAVDSSVNYNGAVQGASYALAAVAAALPSRLNRYFDGCAEHLVLIVAPLSAAILLFYLSVSTEIYAAYVCFGVYHCMFEFSTVVIATRIASTLPHVSAGLRRYALVFATNTLFTLLFQVLMQLLIGRLVFDLDIRMQYLVFCLVLAVLAVLSTLRFVANSLRSTSIQ